MRWTVPSGVCCSDGITYAQGDNIDGERERSEDYLSAPPVNLAGDRRPKNNGHEAPLRKVQPAPSAARSAM
jgi:hypothetical protein